MFSIEEYWTETTHRREHRWPLLPACGEKVGMRGTLRESLTFEFAEAPLPPTLSPQARGEGAQAPCAHSATPTFL